MADYNLEDNVPIGFTTRQFSDGVPTDVVAPTVVIYEDDSVTEITTAEMLSTPDSIPGWNMCLVAATAANGFENDKTYTAVLTAGTVGGVTVAGEVIGSFTIGKTLAAVNAALGTALTELGVGVPSATPDMRDAIMLLYMALRNKTSVTTAGATDYLEINNSSDVIIAKKALTDNGSDYVEAEMISG